MLGSPPNLSPLRTTCKIRMDQSDTWTLWIWLKDAASALSRQKKGRRLLTLSLSSRTRFPPSLPSRKQLSHDGRTGRGPAEAAARRNHWSAAGAGGRKAEGKATEGRRDGRPPRPDVPHAAGGPRERPYSLLSGLSGKAPLLVRQEQPGTGRVVSEDKASRRQN